MALHGATGGTWTLEFLGRVTAALAHDDNAAAVEAALVAIEPGDFTGLFAVTGAGSFADPFVIEVAGRLAGSTQSLVAQNESLTGTGQTLSQSTRQYATGRHWWDNPANWRDFDTGDPGVPGDDDDVWIQTGDDSNAILYGLLPVGREAQLVREIEPVQRPDRSAAADRQRLRGIPPPAPGDRVRVGSATRNRC